MTQKIEHISIKRLVLWTENPRDLLSLSPSMTDQEIADRAISKDGRSRWSLNRLFGKMGEHLDLSELPTVVYSKNRKPIVYDGNRRVLIGKIIHGLVKVEDIGVNFSEFSFPKSIPCNVCDEKTALANTYRKHATTGSWRALERDIFKNRQMGEDKSTFLIFEEATEMISRNPKLNQRFIKDEVLNSNNLEKIGLPVIDGKLRSEYKKDEDAIAVLNAVVEHIKKGEISTRMEPRGDIVRILDKKLLRKKSSNGKSKLLRILKGKGGKTPTPVTKNKDKRYQLFGREDLVLEEGSVNNLYSDLRGLHKIKKWRDWSEDYPAIIHFGLRFIAEQAAFEDSKSLEEYIGEYYEIGKKSMTREEINILHSQNVNKRKVLSLLNIGAHGGGFLNNDHQSVAVSLALAKMLQISHGKKEK